MYIWNKLLCGGGVQYLIEKMAQSVQNDKSNQLKGEVGDRHCAYWFKSCLICKSPTQEQQGQSVFLSMHTMGSAGDHVILGPPWFTRGNLNSHAYSLPHLAQTWAFCASEESASRWDLYRFFLALQREKGRANDLQCAFSLSNRPQQEAALM